MPDEKKKIGRPREWTKEKIDAIAEELYKWYENEENVFFKDFLAMKGLHREHVARFQRVSPAFRDAIKTCKAIQESRIVNGGLSGKFPQILSIFLLKCNHDYIEKREIKHVNVTEDPKTKAELKGMTPEQLKELRRKFVESDS